MTLVINEELSMITFASRRWAGYNCVGILSFCIHLWQCCCCSGVVHHISRLSIQERVLDLSLKKDTGSLCSQSADQPPSTSAASTGLFVRRTDAPDKPSSPLPHLYVVLCH